VLVPLPYGTMRTRRCSGAVATGALGCESAGLSWAEALTRNPMSTTTIEQTKAKVREPNKAAMERPETGVGEKGLNTNTPYKVSE